MSSTSSYPADSFRERATAPLMKLPLGSRYRCGPQQGDIYRIRDVGVA